METETPLFPFPFPANQLIAMEADGTLPSSSSKPVKQAKKSGNRPSLADILQVQEEIRKGKARTKAQFQVEIPKPLAADLRAIEKVFTAELEGFVSYFERGKTFFHTVSKYAIFLETV